MTSSLALEPLIQRGISFPGTTTSAEALRHSHHPLSCDLEKNHRTSLIESTIRMMTSHKPTPAERREKKYGRDTQAMSADGGTGEDGGQGGYTALGDDQLLFIGGEYARSSDGGTFPVTNPMTGDKIYDCASATTDDYTRAIEAAHDAFQAWSRTGPSARRLVLLRAADILETYLDKDAPELLSSEVSATKGWVRLNVLSTVNVLREVAGLATHIKGEIVPADRPGTTILVERVAVGVNFAIAPWNAPVRLDFRGDSQTCSSSRPF